MGYKTFGDGVRRAKDTRPDGVRITYATTRFVRERDGKSVDGNEGHRFMTGEDSDGADPAVTCRPARNWDEVRRTAVTAGRAFEPRKPEGPFFHSRIVDAPGLPLENTLLLEVDGTLAGGLQIYERQVHVGDGTVTAGAIGNVHILPEYRGQGLSRELLAYTHEFIEERGYAFSILGAGVPELYESAGWTPLPYEETVVEAPTGDDPAFDPEFDGAEPDRLRAYRHDADLRALEACYRTAADGVSGRFRRPEWLWRDWVFGEQTSVLDPEQVQVYEEDGRITGYLVTDRDEGDEPDGTADADEPTTVECVETAYVGDDEATFQQTCWHAIAGGAADTERVVWHPPFPSAIEDGIDASIDRVLEDTEMVAGYDWATLSALADRPISDDQDLVDCVTDGPWYWSAVDAF
jgi:GNAT superfamily N-acetyltransferase